MANKKGTTSERALLHIMLRPTKAAEVKLLNDICKSTKETTYTRALLQAGEMYLQQVKTIESQRMEIETLQKVNREATRILQQIKISQANLMEFTKKFPATKHFQDTLF